MAHTVVPAYAGGGVTVTEYNTRRARPLFSTDAQPVPADVEPELDPDFCQERKPDGTQCGARRVRGKDRCAGHERAAAKRGEV